MFRKFWQKIKSNWGFDANEIALLNSRLSQKKTEKPGSKKTLVVQAPIDHYYLTLYAQVIAQYRSLDDYRVIAVGPMVYPVRPKLDLFFPARVIYSIINKTLLRRKWSALYRAVGIDRFVMLDAVPLSQRPKCFLRALKIWKGIKTKKELIDLSVDGVHCGDLIYDTYLRFMVKPTVFLSDPTLLLYIYRCICSIKASRNFATKNEFADFFTSYSTYIPHGIPVRTFLAHNINVYSSGNLQQKFKKLSAGDHFHTAFHKRYRSEFSTLENQREKIAIGTQLLTNKFTGIIDQATFYMKKSAYQNSQGTGKPTIPAFDGVVFLHDFYDSPHVYAGMIFPDFYEWIYHTLNLILKNGLNIGVKPHPNQVASSSKDTHKLQLEFPTIKWIDPATSNSDIIHSGIKFGISVHGTILHELAYHGINPICAGDNPHASYSFVHDPKTKDEYDRMILGFADLNLPVDYKEQVASFYYMHNVHSKNDFALHGDVLTLQDLLHGSSMLLPKLIDKLADKKGTTVPDKNLVA